VLYLIPTPLAPNPHLPTLPTWAESLLPELQIFIVENTRTSKKFLAKTPNINFDNLQFFELNEHTTEQEKSDLAKLLPTFSQNIGLMSEAGCPAVADPGAFIVAKAHTLGIKVVPLVGPSSIMLALMASGMNGQCFAFQGYLPIEKDQKKKKILQFYQLSKQGQSQIFIETPYRNRQFLGDLIQFLPLHTLLCIAYNITGQDEFIQTQTLQYWQKNPPDFHKKPAIFIF
jgi:16S rRNA (cytidine1402-2'-O)-methyltransferase